jgi:hypothetical protein
MTESNLDEKQHLGKQLKDVSCDSSAKFAKSHRISLVMPHGISQTTWSKLIASKLVLG